MFLTSRHTGTTISLLLVNSFKAMCVTCEDCSIYFKNLQSVAVCWKCKKHAEASDEVRQTTLLRYCCLLSLLQIQSCHSDFKFIIQETWSMVFTVGSHTSIWRGQKCGQWWASLKLRVHGTIYQICSQLVWILIQQSNRYREHKTLSLSKGKRRSSLLIVLTSRMQVY